MQYHAAGEECNLMKCNENVENASKCMSMHLNAYGKKQHHFREKTTHIPSRGKKINLIIAVARAGGGGNKPRR